MSIEIKYFLGGKLHKYTSSNLTFAMNRKFLLRRRYGINQCGHFHYFDENGERQWL